METTPEKIRITWYRSPLTREQLRDLNQRSDLKGFLQVGGFLAVIALTASAVIYSVGRWPWPVVLLLLFIHGTCWSCISFGFHELVHDSVFKTRWLNAVFLRILAFLGWQNPHQFWASHMEHHKYTLHPPDDLEVVLPIRCSIKGFLQQAFFNPMEFKWFLDMTERHARGKLEGTWEKSIFPDSNPQARRRLFNWARILLLGHGTIIVVSVIMHWWMVPVVITLPRLYGGWMFYLYNNSQHMGLQDNVNDFRLCCRTVVLNPVLSFLYWHMNYHTEHHMYAAVPCYNLPKLHEIIKDDLPPCPHGLLQAWREIAVILERQKRDPTYQYVPELPAPSKRPSAAAGPSLAAEPTPAAKPA